MEDPNRLENENVDTNYDTDGDIDDGYGGDDCTMDCDTPMYDPNDPLGQKADDCEICGRSAEDCQGDCDDCDCSDHDGFTDPEADADTLASAGFGTDEDYGGGCEHL